MGGCASDQNPSPASSKSSSRPVIAPKKSLPLLYAPGKVFSSSGDLVNVLKVDTIVDLPASNDPRCKSQGSYPKRGKVVSTGKEVVVKGVSKGDDDKTWTFDLCTFPENVKRLCEAGCTLGSSTVPYHCSYCGSLTQNCSRCGIHGFALCRYCCGQASTPSLGSKVVSGPTHVDNTDTTSEQGEVVAVKQGKVVVRWGNGKEESCRTAPFQDVIEVCGRLAKDIYSYEKGFTFGASESMSQSMDMGQGGKSVCLSRKPSESLDNSGTSDVSALTREVVNSNDLHEFTITISEQACSGTISVGVAADTISTDESLTLWLRATPYGVSFFHHNLVVEDHPEAIIPSGSEVTVRLNQNHAEFIWAGNKSRFPVQAGNYRFGVSLDSLGSQVIIKDGWRPPKLRWSELNIRVNEPGSILGEGAHGITYKGEVKGVPVAVKVLKQKHNGNPIPQQDRNAYYKREVATLLATHGHPNSLRLVGLVPDVQGIATELCDCDLKQYITNRGTRLSSRARLDLAHGVAKGLLNVTNSGYVHCDVNCSNVFVLNDKGVIGDYGLALPISQVKGKRGSYPYIAPEVFEGKGNSVASDVFSFAMLLRFIYTGLEPTPDDYAGAPKGPANVCSNLKGKTAQLASGVVAGMRPSLPETIPASVRGLIKKCWADDPAERPTFDSIVQSIEKMITKKNSK
eukprot:TRINITY_DN14341_c0_g1_i1.p1 TRINITY_DN14341_c0_g1~~TRINITY_DN14341_c0_g1_i1.p1  ORF type:complete len:701 (+),score=119.09 TRINITY_DN14341_c0_g1_i1:56-2104(+)